MTPLRRLLAPFTAIWLLCQVGTMVLVPTVLWAMMDEHHEGDDCTCGHGPGVMCPMHKKPARSSAPCAMQAANSSELAVLATVAGITGLTPAVASSVVAPTSAPHVVAADVRVADHRPVPPDPPPPRA